MFGYIQPDTPYLFIKDEKLYHAAYCGMCKAIGKSCGNVAKTALTYDIAFISCLIHNIAGVDMVVKKRFCALHPFKRKLMALHDDISLTLGCVNTVLAYYKLLDDKADGEKKGMFSFVYKHGYKRTLKAHPEIVRIVAKYMQMQAEIEKRDSDIIEEACEPSALMLKELSSCVLGERSTEHTEGLLYDIGKWVYLADAFDDFEKDKKKGRYNVLRNCFKEGYDCKTCEDEVNFILNNLFADMRYHLSNIDFKFNHDLTDNIILRGIPLKSRALVKGLFGCEKCKNK